MIANGLEREVEAEGLVTPGISHRAHVAPVVPRAQLRVVSECGCTRRHRSSRTFARCAWPAATEVTGRGFLALVITCEAPRVLLVERLRWAHTLRAEYAVFGCSALCTGEHELLALEIDGELRS